MTAFRMRQLSNRQRSDLIVTHAWIMLRARFYAGGKAIRRIDRERPIMMGLEVSEALRGSS